MGSITRMSRNGRYIQFVGPKILESKGRYDLKNGDCFELMNFGMGETEDGSEVVKIYTTFQNKRTGDEYIFTDDNVQFDPEENSHDSVDRVTQHMSSGTDDEEQLSKHQKEAIRLLQKADLISKNYDAEEVA